MAFESYNLNPKLLVFTWETYTNQKVRIGKSVEDDYSILVEEAFENFWKWTVNRGKEWIMDSGNYPKGNCENENDAIRLAREVATTHYSKNKKAVI